MLADFAIKDLRVAREAESFCSVAHHRKIGIGEIMRVRADD